MSFDSTALAIIVALAGSGIFLTLEFYRHKDIDITNCVVIFLAFYAVFGGYELIAAALEGDPENLPKTWREYLGVAGVVAIGLSLQHIIKTVNKVWVKSGKAEKASKETSS